MKIAVPCEVPKRRSVIEETSFLNEATDAAAERVSKLDNCSSRLLTAAAEQESAAFTECTPVHETGTATTNSDTRDLRDPTRADANQNCNEATITTTATNDSDSTAVLSIGTMDSDVALCIEDFTSSTPKSEETMKPKSNLLVMPFLKHLSFLALPQEEGDKKSTAGNVEHDKEFGEPTESVQFHPPHMSTEFLESTHENGAAPLISGAKGPVSKVYFSKRGAKYQKQATNSDAQFEIVQSSREIEDGYPKTKLQKGFKPYKEQLVTSELNTDASKIEDTGKAMGIFVPIANVISKETNVSAEKPEFHYLSADPPTKTVKFRFQPEDGTTAEYLVDIERGNVAEHSTKVELLMKETNGSDSMGDAGERSLSCRVHSSS